MNISILLKNLVDIELNGELNVLNLALNSNEITEGCVFIALSGTHHHGLSYAKLAIEKGAIAILFDSKESKLAEECLSNLNILKIPVANLAQNLSLMASRFYGTPSQFLNVIGITGTNGKTSCSQFLAQALESCAVIGTLGWGAYGQLKPTLNTTPDALALQKMFATLVKDGYENVAMEVSSHGLAQGRTHNIHFKGAVFTNFSRDHLDYHGTMESYLDTKLKLFKTSTLEFVVVNLDDEVSEKIISIIPEQVSIIGITTTGKQSPRGQTLISKNVTLDLSGIQFDILWQNQILALHVPLIGLFNLENVLCVLAVMLALNIELEHAAKCLAHLKAIEGRMECFGGGDNQPLIIVDYAHTPIALEKVLCALRLHTQGNLGVIFGCGGNRDQGKRSQMGRIAEEFADWVIITDDNPRFESNEMIVLDILSGCFNNEAKIIHDRCKAIHTAIAQSKPFDCVLIAGKGHENYQEINGIQFPFNDTKCVLEFITPL